MANNEAGAFLNISPDVLKKMDSFDDKLTQIEKHAHTAADALKNGFGKVVVDTTKLESAITQLADKMNALHSASNAVGNIGQAAQGSARGVSSMNESLSRAGELANKIWGGKFGKAEIGNLNIAELKEGISDLKKYLENTKLLTKHGQKYIVEAMRYMKMQLDYQRQTDEQRAQSAEKAAQRKEAADRRAYKASADLAKAQNYKQNTTAQGALDFSKTAHTLQRQITAIEYLKKARLSLNTTDKNYQATLQQINQAIARHNQALTEAGVRSQQLATRHRNLMDTAGQLRRQLALLFSVSQIEGYISKLADVRGEFELQQRSLQAILQNKSQADQIFNKTVQLAVKSPFQIKELVTFTKQLAAYRIESDKLYDTTKRLADVSAGLGVDMGRLILAYGQVKAAAYLRGTEVRQFTEAGINLYGELQRYFEEVKGEAYTTAQIVDMISKRKVTFEDIENIFQRLTDKGDLFYNMQEIQAETLRGKISNLQDSIDVMLNSIGKANEDTLKGTIDSVKVLIDNWEILAESLKGVVAILALVKLQSILTSEKMLLMAIDMGVMTKGVQKSLTLWQLLRMGLIGVSNAFKALGKAILSNIYLVSLAAIAYAIKQIYDNYAEYNKALEENTKKYNENIAPINSLIAKYRELTEEANKAKAAQDKNFDAHKNRKDRENIVSRLIGKFKEYGIEENIGDVSKLTDEELENNLDRLNKKYRDLQNTILGFANAYAEVNSRSALNPANWQDRLEGDSKDLKEAGNEMLVYSSRVTQMLDIVGAHYSDLSSKLAGYYNEVKKGPDTSKGESEVEWLLRALDALKKINAESQVVKNEFSTGKYSLFDITSSAKDFYSQKTEFEEEIDRLKIELENKSIKDPVLVSIALNQIAIDKEWSDLEKNIARKRLELPLVTPINDNKNRNDGTDTDPKHERDILSERISLIKEINKEYEKLNKVMGSDKAAKTVMERYATQLRDVKMPKNIIGEAFLPNKENTAKALQEFSKTISDFRKRIGAQKDANVLFDEKDSEDIKNQLDKTKKNIEDMFNGLDLHKKLKDAGLSEAEVQQLFPGLSKTLDEVEKGIEIEFQTKYADTYKDPNTTQYKEYQDAIKKLEQQRIKESQDLVAELTKAYKTQLSDQLQLDRWYYEERAKIAKANLTEEQKTQYESNLKSQYNKKSDENTWKQFQNSDMYISMFENIESSSTRMLEAMRNKLASLRENLKNLPADQLKAIINQQEKIDEMISKKNPFSGLTSDVKEYIQFLKQRKELEEENIRANNAVEFYTKQRDIQSNIVQQKQLEYNKEVELNGVGSAKALNLKLQLEYEKKQLDIILKKLVAEGKITEETAEQIRNGQKLGETLSDKFGNIGSTLSEFSSALPQIAGDLENVFGTMSARTADTISSIAEIAGGLGQTASGVARAIANPADIGGYIQTIGGLAKTIGSIFNIKDKKKEREIQRQIKNVEKLQDAYDVLKEKTDNAWNSVTLHDTTKQTTKNIDQQIQSYQQMIKAEQDKKKTDQDRIDEWNDAIKELQKTKQEIMQQEQMDLGGIGGESEYKSAAENFVQAWMDAFNETGEGIDGLKDSFDSLIDNLIVKQATMRLAQGRLKTLFDAIDKSVTDNSAGGINLTKEELANINSIADSALKGLNDDLLALMETLGYKGTGDTAELSALQQGIQAMSEETAGELQALLNSIRWFVSQQTTDISAIRMLLDARYGLESEYSDSNPMLVELRAQTGYLEIISDRIDRVFAPNSNSRGAGIRVFISD